MRIGVDASRAFEEQKTGTESYAFNILKNILMLPEASRHEWVVYLRGGQSSKVAEWQRLWPFVTLQTLNLPYLWTQIGLAWRTWVDKLDVLWVPAHTLPVLANPRVKTVVTVHGLEYEWLPSFENWLQRWYLPFSTQFVAKRASRIIAVSNFTKDTISTRLGVDEHKIRVVWEGVGEKILNPKSEILNKFKIQKKKYIMFVGTVQPRKNLRRLVEAYSRLVYTSPLTPLLNSGEGNGRGEVLLVIAGKLGWGYAEVLKAPEEFGVVGRVRFLEYVGDEERQVLYENALVYVQPSITEGFGLPVIEAMAAGLPVVSSRGGALEEISKIKEGYATLLFNPLDVRDMTEKLKMVLEDPGLREALIRRGRRRAKEFSWERAASQTLQILENVT